MTRLIGLPFAFVLIGFLLSGCSSAPVESTERDQIAKSFQTKPNQAKIYIYRNKFVAGFFAYRVWVNDRLIGSISASTFQMLVVKPGKYNFRIPEGSEPTKEIDAKGGRLYFLFVDTNVGLFRPNVSINEQNLEDGKEAVLARQLGKRRESP